MYSFRIGTELRNRRHVMTRCRQSISVLAISLLAFACAVLGLASSARADDKNADAGASGPEERIKEALAEPTELEFFDTSLNDAIDILKARHGIEIQLDAPALLDAGVGSDTPLTKSVRGITLRSALRLLLDQHELTSVIRNEVLLITSKTEAEGMLETKVYPVGDLVRAEDDGLVVEMRPEFDNLVESVTSTIAPNSWDDVGGPGSIQPFANADALVVSQTDVIHEEIEKLLASLRETRAKQARQAGSQKQPPPDDTALTLRIYRLPASFKSSPLSGAPTAAPSQPAEQPKAAPSTPGGATLRGGFHPQFGGGALTTAGAGQAAREGTPAEELAKVIPTVVEPESWQMAGGQGAIHAVAGSLLVRQTERVHRQIRRLLTAIE
ncbi:MAG: hypothetical protein WD403_12530 [Pirellulales bacterium]